jgi:hypothetical protein
VSGRKEANPESASKEAVADHPRGKTQVGPASGTFPLESASKENAASRKQVGPAQAWGLLAGKTGRRPLSMEGNKLSWR